MLRNDFQMGKFQVIMLQLAVWKIQDANMVKLVSTTNTLAHLITVKVTGMLLKLLL